LFALLFAIEMINFIHNGINVHFYHLIKYSISSEQFIALGVLHYFFLFCMTGFDARGHSRSNYTISQGDKFPEVTPGEWMLQLLIFCYAVC